MQKHFRIAVFTIIGISLFVFPGVSQGSQEGSFIDRPSGNQQGPRRPDMPQPTESELLLLHLKGLIDDAQSRSEFAVTEGQAEALLPILLDWEESIGSDSDEATEGYINEITAELTDAQKTFITGPLEGMAGGSGPSGNKGSKGQKPPKNRPEIIEISSLLIELIEALSL